MNRPQITISYLEMSEAPQKPLPALEVLAASPFPSWYFLALYKAVGEVHHWTDMLELPQKALDEYCTDPQRTLYTLIEEGRPVGFFVLHKQDKITDLAYFGITSEGMGRGLGSALLDYAIGTAWKREGMEGLTVNTCTLDHKNALPLYLSRGFVIIKEEERLAY